MCLQKQYSSLSYYLLTRLKLAMNTKCNQNILVLKSCNILSTINKNHKDMVDAAYKTKQADKKLLSTIPTLKVIVFDLQQCMPIPDLKHV